MIEMENSELKTPDGISPRVMRPRSPSKIQKTVTDENKIEIKDNGEQATNSSENVKTTEI